MVSLLLGIALAVVLIAAVVLWLRAPGRQGLALSSLVPDAATEEAQVPPSAADAAVAVQPVVEKLSPPLPDAPAKPKLGLVLTSLLNVREGPSRDSQRKGLLRYGDVVELTGGEDAGWYPVKVEELQGFVSGAYIIELAPGKKVPGPPQRGPRQPTPEGGDETAAAKPLPERATKSAAGSAQARRDEKPAPEQAPLTRPRAKKRPELPPPAAVTLSRSGLKAEVHFPHSVHLRRFECVKCHHPFGDSPGANEQKLCHTCHTGVVAKEKFHKTCRGCHEALSETPAVGKPLPMKCDECHKSLPQ